MTGAEALCTPGAARLDCALDKHVASVPGSHQWFMIDDSMEPELPGPGCAPPWLTRTPSHTPTHARAGAVFVKPPSPFAPYAAYPFEQVLPLPRRRPHVNTLLGCGFAALLLVSLLALAHPPTSGAASPTAPTAVPKRLLAAVPGSTQLHRLHQQAQALGSASSDAMPAFAGGQGSSSSTRSSGSSFGSGPHDAQAAAVVSSLSAARAGSRRMLLLARKTGV